MVPARLLLRNFLCYRDCPPIDLDGVHVACLTGDNGNGKSALLDAITWALWGKARSNRDAELVSLGATEMEVEFEFYAGEGRYRVIRKWRKVGARGGSAGLEFQLRDGEGWRVLSGSTIAETERAIQQLLKLSYETFINSSFLVQGKSGLFTSKTAAERKAVLAEILDLGRYDAWESQTRVLLREAQDRVTRRKDAIVTMESEVRGVQSSVYELPRLMEGAASLQEQLQAAQEEQRRLQAAAHERLRLHEVCAEMARARAAAAQRLAAARAGAAEHAPLVAGFEAMLGRAELVEAAYARLVEARRTEQHLRMESARLRAEGSAAGSEAGRLAEQQRTLERAEHDLLEEIDGYAARLRDGGRIRAGYAALEEARRTQADQSPRALRAAALERQQTALQQRITSERERLIMRIAACERERGSFAPLGARLPEWERRLAGLHEEGADTAALRRGLLDAQQAERERREEVAALTTENLRLRAEMDALKKRVEEIEGAAHREEARCPLCRTPLGHEGLLQVKVEYETQGRDLAARFRANKPRIAELEAAAQAEAERARRLGKDLERHTGARRQALGEAEANVKEARMALERLAALDAERAELTAALEEEAFCRQEREQLDAVERAIGETGFDKAAHEAAMRRSVELAHFEGEYRALSRAEAGMEAATQARQRAQQQLEGVRAQVAAARRRAEVLTAEADALPLAALAGQVAELEGYDGEYQRLQQARGGIELARAALQMHRANEERAAAELEEAERRLAEAEQALVALPETEAALRQSQEQVHDLQGRIQLMQQELGRVKNDVQRLETLQARLKEYGGLLEAEQREAGIYTELVQAFGKRGVQGLLIETVLPEIEEAANELLARMTNNRMHLTLDTQRVTLKGETTETLDVKIADEWGTRPYEMFSGGEAFRIDLALRIALSKLLARRAGAPLATLVIDEGFGTQDAAGRERLVEAITAIQDHFQCLLLVTHISELKDQFETRIEVTKNGDGSIARVVAA